MKPVFFCLCVLNIIFVLVIPAYCQDFFVGKVVAVDVQKMEIEVEPQSSLQLFKEAEGGHTVTVRLSKRNTIKTNERGSPFPGCVVPGKRIRLWGEKESSSRVFIVTDIRGCGGGGCQDPTGVRSRLRKMWERTYQQLSAADHNRDGVREGSDREGRGAGGGNGNGGHGGGNGGGGGRK